MTRETPITINNKLLNFKKYKHLKKMKKRSAITESVLYLFNSSYSCSMIYDFINLKKKSKPNTNGVLLLQHDTGRPRCMLHTYIYQYL